MATHNIRIDLGSVDFGSLHSDDDFRREAKRLLPAAMVKLGQEVGEKAWKALQDGFRGMPGIKVNSSSAEREKFVREAGQEYRNQASASDRQELEDHIISQLKEQKKANS